VATDAKLKSMGKWLAKHFGPDYGADYLGALMLVLDYDRDDAYHRCDPRNVDKLAPSIRELWEKEHGPVPDRSDKRPPMTRTARGIQKVLADLGIIEPDEKIKVCRTRAGRDLLSTGAWSWWAEREYRGVELAGSPLTCQEIIAAHRQGRVVNMGGMPPELYVEEA
jgi:hypothetical protein